MRDFKAKFEELGYTFQNADILEDVYLFYKYYESSATKGISAILLEGDPGSGKTYLSEVFSEFLGDDTEYLYTQCVDETNSEKLIATINVPAIVKGDGDKAIAEGILTKAITLANEGKRVVLTIDELDKAREALDSYFLDFLQSGKIETSDNEILSVTEEGRKNLYVILAKNNERDLLDALLRRCSVIYLPPMPPVLAYKTLLRKFENVDHDAKFLKFIAKVYEAIYNEQMDSNNELFRRLPSLQELITAISGDYELYKNGVSSSRRIRSLVRKLGKDQESRDIITNILVNKFKYQEQESNYTNETLNLDMSDPENYMSNKDSESLVEQYIEKKDNGEYIFEEEEFDDPMKDIASILDNMKDDQVLVFLDSQNKEKIVELGVITHSDPRALDILFDKIRFRGNPNSRFGFLYFEEDNFIGLMKYRNTLILVANKEYVSPRLFIRGLSSIIRIIYDIDENLRHENMYFSDFTANQFKLSGLNAKILSNAPKLVMDKMTLHNGLLTYGNQNLKITYDDTLNMSYIRYLQRFKAEPLFEVIQKLCEFNPELALPVSFIGAKEYSEYMDRKYFKKRKTLESHIETLEEYLEEGWELVIDDFDQMKLSFVDFSSSRNSWDDTPEVSTEKGVFVFDWKEKKDKENKKLYLYPKYKIRDGFLVYTRDEDFYDNKVIKNLDPFQKEIAYLARDIFGNFVPLPVKDKKQDYFSSLTMSVMGRIIEDPSIRKKLIDDESDITKTKAFDNYYNSIAEVSAIITPEKVLRRN